VENFQKKSVKDNNKKFRDWTFIQISVTLTRKEKESCVLCFQWTKCLIFFMFFGILEESSFIECPGLEYKNIRILRICDPL